MKELLQKNISKKDYINLQLNTQILGIFITRRNTSSKINKNNFKISIDFLMYTCYN